VQAGADINAPCGPRGECRTPLHIAAEHGHVLNIQVPYVTVSLFTLSLVILLDQCSDLPTSVSDPDRLVGYTIFPNF
jgi:hypothetical protein